jgi:hypothetical protein
MTTYIKIATAFFLFLVSCHTKTKQEDNSSIFIDSIQNNVDTTATHEQKIIEDTSSNVFVAMLKDGLDNVKATINDSTMFVATKGQLILYWNYPHTALIADGRFGYIPPELLVRIDTPCFKFNFSKRKFIYDKKYELYQSAKKVSLDLNSLAKRIQQKDSNALLQFFKLRKVVDGASAEEFPDNFWSLINLWSDKELSSFISTLDKLDKKAFCELLIESSYCDPYEYYKLYYPLTFQQINLTK